MNDTAKKTASLKYIWLGLAFLSAGLLCNRWFASQDARAKVTVDAIHAAVDRQHDAMGVQSRGLAVRSVATGRKIAEMQRLVLAQQQSLARGDPLAQQRVLEAEIKNAQAEAAASLDSDGRPQAMYADAGARYSAAVATYVAASAQYVRTLNQNTRTQFVLVNFCLGGAMVSVGISIVSSCCVLRWRRIPSVTIHQT